MTLGTTIYLYGSANCSYTVLLDDQLTQEASNPSDGLLFFQDDLSPGSHSIMLTAKPGDPTAQVALDKAVFTNVGVNSR